MATKSYSKHKEFKEYSSSSSTKGVPYTDEQFDMIKSELLPKGSKLDSLAKHGGGREYHYEYKEEKHPSGKYDRKDLRTVEEFTVPPKSPKTESSYYYEREERELPAITAGTRTYNYESSSSTTPGYSRVKNSKAHNVEELDLLLDDLQRDQERQLYKSGYTSDTAESTSFDYKRGTPAKAPSSGYSTLRREERLESSSWAPPPPPATTEIRREEMFREEKHESRVVPSVISPAIPLAVPSTVCTHCHHSTGTLSRSSTPMNKVTTTVKTYTYEVPADRDPASEPLPAHADHQHTYVSTENVHSSSTTGGAGCQHCPHCSGSREYHAKITSDDRTLTNERIVHVTPANETKLVPSEPRNGHGPYGPTSYKFSETSYSSHNLSQSAPFPRPHTPTPAPQQPPKKLDDLLADFPEARFPTQPDGVVQRKIAVTHESTSQAAKPAPAAASKNVSGPPVYYPPGHTPFVAKESAGYSSAAMQGGGAYASGRGMYEYESGAKSKSKHSEKKTAVPVCLPLCCAMPCVIM